MIEEAIGWLAITWVIISWLRMLVPAESNIQRFLCLKCAAFWLTLAITMDPITSAVASLIAMVVDTYQNNTKITL
jgi:hypothetical protein